MSIVCHIRELDGMPVDPTKTKLELEVEIMGQDDEEVRMQVINQFCEDEKKKYTKDFERWRKHQLSLSNHVLIFL